MTNEYTISEADSVKFDDLAKSKALGMLRSYNAGRDAGFDYKLAMEENKQMGVQNYETALRYKRVAWVWAMVATLNAVLAILAILDVI